MRLGERPPDAVGVGHVRGDHVEVGRAAGKLVGLAGHGGDVVPGG